MRVIMTLAFVATSHLMFTARADVNVLFSPNGGVKTRIINELASAHRRIDVAMYSFTDFDLHDTLIGLARKGVTVRLLLDKPGEKSSLATKFEKNGIDVRFVDPILHHKFAVIDGPSGSEKVRSHARVLAGSGNWSRSADQFQDEDFLVFSEVPNKIRTYQREFDYIWDRAEDYDGRYRSPSRESVKRAWDTSTLFTSANFDAEYAIGGYVFNPLVELNEGVAGRAIVDAINRAQVEIKIATTHFHRSDFYSALLAAHERGVRISILLDQQEYQGFSEDLRSANADALFDEKLASAGVDVRYKVYMINWNPKAASRMHLKYMIVDGIKVFTGSFNWSETSELASFENLNILSGPEVRQYEENFERIFNYDGDDGLENVLSLVQQIGGRGPCYFTPFALTPERLESLLAAYQVGACASP